MQLTWVAKAIEELGGAVPDVAELTAGAAGQAGGGGARGHRRQTGSDAQAFVDRWRPKIDHMENARHAKMLRVILGEVLEQKRFFEQALAGRIDLLGQREVHLEPARGDVLPSRWIE